jgi:hypothetical protein
MVTIRRRLAAASVAALLGAGALAPAGGVSLGFPPPPPPPPTVRRSRNRRRTPRKGRKDDIDGCRPTQ